MLTSLKSLLQSIVDYAGLFPPAQLSLSDAVRIYDQAQASSHSWMLDRFVIPSPRLPELLEALATLTDRQSYFPWSLSVILSSNWAAELAQLQTINGLVAATLPLQIAIKAWEIAPLPPTEIPQVCQCLPPGISAFFEIPFQAAVEPYIDALHQTHTAAKLRTGGVTQAAFPDHSQLSQRILTLAEAQIPFKATAGLHHPLPSKSPLTDPANRPIASMHGFLNVALLAAFANQQQISVEEAIALLEVSTIEQFDFTDTQVTWHDRTLTVTEIMHARQQFFHSFGSCSFQDPITDLHTLGLL